MTGSSPLDPPPIPWLARILKRVLDWSFAFTASPFEIHCPDELLSAQDKDAYFTLFLPNHKRALDGFCLAYTLLTKNLQPYPKFLAHYGFRASRVESTFLQSLGVYLPRFRSSWLQANRDELRCVMAEVERLTQLGNSLVIFLENKLSYSGRLNPAYLSFLQLLLKVCKKKGYSIRLIPVSLTYDHIPEATMSGKLHRIGYTVSSALKTLWKKLLCVRKSDIWRRLRSNHHCQITFAKPYYLDLQSPNAPVINHQFTDELSTRVLQTLQLLSSTTVNNVEAVAGWLLRPQNPKFSGPKVEQILLGLELERALEYLRHLANPLHRQVANPPSFAYLADKVNRSAFIATSLRPTLQVLSAYQITYQLRGILPNLLCLTIGRLRAQNQPIRELFSADSEAAHQCMKWLEATFFLPGLLMKSETQFLFTILPDSPQFKAMICFIENEILLPLLSLLNRICFMRNSLMRESLHDLKSNCFKRDASSQERMFDPWKDKLLKEILYTDSKQAKQVGQFCQKFKLGIVSATSLDRHLKKRSVLP